MDIVIRIISNLEIMRCNFLELVFYLPTTSYPNRMRTCLWSNHPSFFYSIVQRCKIYC